jgi:GT2 family glycosyltransferase
LKIAVLLTCFNRKEKTKKCLQVLFDQELPENCLLEVFLCDDGSSDNTSVMIGEIFPQVRIVQGNGSLYWNGGMNLAWAEARKTDQFDFFLWLNDDTYLYPQALVKLLTQYQRLSKPGILVGACQDPNSGRFSFGGANDKGAIIPNGQVQKVKMINGNVVLIPSEIDTKLNGLSKDYVHYYGDYDYGLRAISLGYNCYSTEEYIASCEINRMPYWGDARLSLSKRWNLAHDVKGLALAQYFHFIKTHEGWVEGIRRVMFTYARVLFPNLFLKIRGN